MSPVDVGATESFPRAPEVCGVYIGTYKNLRDIWLPWSSRMVLIGPNGVGKTNILDCCALLMGTELTADLVERRVPKDLEYDISVVLRGVRPSADLAWLRDIGAFPDETFSESLSRIAAGFGASKELLSGLSDAVAEGLIRYRLQASHGEKLWSTTLVTSGRERKIRPLGPLADVPTAFAPLLPGWVDGCVGSGKGGTEQFVDALVLAPDDDVPVDLQWLPFQRSGSEIVAGFNKAILESSWALGVRFEHDDPIDSEGPASTLMGALGRLGDARGHDDVIKQIVAIAEAGARDELRRTAPAVADVRLVPQHLQLASLYSYTGDEDGYPLAAVEIQFDSELPYRRFDAALLGSSDSVEAAEVMSAGERRWFDEAMLSAEVTLTRRDVLARVVANVIWDALNEPGEEAGSWMRAAIAEGVLYDNRDDLELMRLIAEESRDPADILVFLRTYMEARSALKDLSIASHPEPATPRLEDWLGLLDIPERSGMDSARRARIRVALEEIWSTLGSLKKPRARVRVFDEPEAHLHSGAVGSVADALTSMGQSADVLVASHHPRFIYQPEWTPFRVQRDQSNGQTELCRYNPSVPQQRRTVAASLGLTAGEALAGARAMLLVEGKHDERVLRESVFAKPLNDAGVVVLPMRGVNELGTDREASALALEFVLMFAPDVIGIMFDNDPGSETDQTPEQRKVSRFVDAARSQGREILRVGLERPDIVAYLNPSAVARDFTWESALQEFADSGSGQRFKEWLKYSYSGHIDLTTDSKLQDVLKRMRERPLPFESELARKINGFVAQVNDRATRAQLGEEPTQS